MNIEPAKCCIPKRDKINEIIKALNPLLQIEVRQYGSDTEVKYTSSNVLITIPEGGGVPDGYDEEILDVVESGNTAGQRYFLTKSA